MAFSVPGADASSRTLIDIAEIAFQPATLTAIAGPSGSGKSTLLYLLAGLLAPERGMVVWDGRNIAGEGEGARDRWRRDHAGFIFQNFHLLEELSPLDNVLAPAWFANFSARPWRARASALLDRFGVPREAKRTTFLSRGEQQRVAIARALLFDPRIVFADEPTASLDAAAGEGVIGALAEMAGAGKTVIVVTHDPQLLARAARIIRLDHGRLADREQASAA
ncbi:MAG: ATP-binding cassette domain-containing protein [Mesorhizobium sp.]|nr:ATP-binding cassette domain-containing protein [Mesorhizobium sp.]